MDLAIFLGERYVPTSPRIVPAGAPLSNLTENLRPGEQCYLTFRLGIAFATFLSSSFKIDILALEVWNTDWLGRRFRTYPRYLPRAMP
jgi:hypothetical protein